MLQISNCVPRFSLAALACLIALPASLPAQVKKTIRVKADTEVQIDRISIYDKIGCGYNTDIRLTVRMSANHGRIRLKWPEGAIIKGRMNPCLQDPVKVWFEPARGYRGKAAAKIRFRERLYGGTQYIINRRWDYEILVSDQ